jgi:hypothetical protein
MKAILTWTKNFFEGPKGESSSKRLFAFYCLIAGIYCAVVNRDALNATVFVSAMTVLLGVSAITKS